VESRNALKPQINADERRSDLCRDLALQNSLVAFVASGLVHTEITTAWKRWT
jgi:hypothetical protein